MYFSNIRILSGVVGPRPQRSNVYIEVRTYTPAEWREDLDTDGLLRSWALGVWLAPRGRGASVRLLGLEVSASW